MWIWSGAAALLIAFAVLPSLAAAEGVLERVAKQGEIRLAYRPDAAPFSFMPEGATEPKGYSVELCRTVAKAIKAELKLATLKVSYVKVTAVNRFQAITEGKADLLCEATTATLKRRATINFSIPTFLSGAGMMINPGGPKDFGELAGKKVSVLAGTTTEVVLKDYLRVHKIAADIVTVKRHSDGFAQLESGASAAYVADRTVLLYMILQRNKHGRLLLADQFLSIEPYALAMPRGDDDFRLEVDKVLSRQFREGGGTAIFAKVLGEGARPTGLQDMLFVISRLPE
jgi:polar amino acid transport system substrate-binding protein/glutamate/aspartate transport system substrate-binding protein